MIVKITLAISAEHPNLPLDTAATFVGSAATFSITGVPTLPAISVSAVAVSVTNASGAVSTVAAVSDEDGWTATFPASHFAAAGTVRDGVVVVVSGTDENGAARTWMAGVGTIVILSSSPVPTPGDVVYNVRLFDAEPTTPTDGDLWPDGEGGYLIYQDGEAHALGGRSVTVDDALSTESENPVQNKVVTGAINDVSTEAGGAYAIATGLGGVVDGITAKIPASASSSNKLVTESDLSSAVTPLEATSNKVTTLSAQSTDVQYPSAKCVFDGLAGKADATSLPYALVSVTPTAGAPFVLAACFPIKYTLADEGATETTVTDAADVTIEGYDEGEGITAWKLIIDSRDICFVNLDGTYDMLAETVSLTFGDPASTPTADTTPVIGFPQNYALTDRAISAVSLSADATLAFPAATAGKARDFVVRLTLSASAAVTFAAPTGETITWDSSGDPSGTFAAGTHLYRITEVAAGVFHAEDMFALEGKMPKYAFSAVQTISSAGTEQSPNEVALADAQNKRVVVTAAGAYISVAALAMASDGIIRDMMLTLDCSTLSDGDEPHVTFASVYKGADDDANNLVADAGAVNVYYVTEYAPNAFLVAKQAIGGAT